MKKVERRKKALRREETMNVSEKVSTIAPSMTLAITAKSNDMKAAGIRVLNFGIGEPDFDTPAYICDAAKDALDKGYTKYVAASGIPALKKAICKKLKDDNGLEYEPSQIIVSNGAKHSIFNAVYATINPGDEVIIPVPYWLTYPEVVKCVGGVPVYVAASPECGYKVTAAQIEAAVTKKTKMLIFNSPNNPTGAVYSEKEIREIAAVCARHDIIILSDEIYEKLIYGGLKHFSIAASSPEAKDLTILINGMSKSYAMTGWRVGYLAAPKNVASAISSFQSHATSNVNTMAQYASLAALEGPKEPMEEMVKAFSERRDYMLEIMDGMKPLGFDYVKPDGAFYVMMLCEKLYGKSYKGKKIAGSLDMADLLLTEKHIAVTPGACFGDDRAVRISYALSKEDIKEGLSAIADFAAELE